MTSRSLAIADILHLQEAMTRKTVTDGFSDFDARSCVSNPEQPITANRELDENCSPADSPSYCRTSLRPCSQWIPVVGQIPLAERLAVDCARPRRIPSRRATYQSNRKRQSSSPRKHSQRHYRHCPSPWKLESEYP